MRINTEKIDVEISPKELKHFKLFNGETMMKFLKLLTPEEGKNEPNTIGFNGSGDTKDA